MERNHRTIYEESKFTKVEEVSTQKEDRIFHSNKKEKVMVDKSRDQIIVGIIFESKLILDTYKQFNYPTDGEQFDKFILEVTKLFVTDKLEFHRMKDTIEFLMNNKGNNLPKQSSGSLYTSLEDIDNIRSGVEWFVGEELDDFHDAFFNRVYFATFN